MIENLGPAASGFPANAAEVVAGRVYVVTLGLQPARLAEYDPTERVVTHNAVIPTGLRCWATAAIGTDLYLGMWGTTGTQRNLYRFDTVRRTLQGFRPVDTEYSSMAAAPDGRTIYLGTARAGVVYAWQPGTAQARPVAFDDPSGSPVTALACTATTVYVGLGRKRAGLVTIDRSSGAARHILPDALAGGVGVYNLRVSREVIVAATQDEPARVAVIDRNDPATSVVVEPESEHAIGAIAFHGPMVYFSGISSGTLFGFDRDTGEVTALATPVPNAPTRRTQRVDGSLVGVTGPGIAFDYELETGRLVRTDLIGAGAKGGTERPQSLAVVGGQAGNDGVVVVGTNNAAEIHATDGGASRRVVVTGEAKTATTVGDAVLLATYPGGQLWRLRAEGQPERVADWPDEQDRPRAIHHDPEAGLLLIATNADFVGGGALVVTDEDGTLLAVHVDPLSGRQAPNAVASLPGGVAVLGGIGDDPRLAAVDARSGERLWETVPVPGGERISGLAARGRFVYGLARNGTLFVLDAATRQVTGATKVADGRTGELAVVAGAIYAVDGSRLFRVHPNTLAQTVLAGGLVHTAFTPNPPVRGDARGRLYVFRDTDLLRVTDTSR